jgi:hypothetical protein
MVSPARCEQRGVGGDGDERAAAGGKQAAYGLQRGFVLLDMFQDIEQADEVELLRGERQAVRKHAGVDLRLPSPCLRNFARGVVHFHRRDVAELGQQGEIAAGAGAEFEDLRVGGEFEVANGGAQNPPPAGEPPMAGLDGGHVEIGFRLHRSGRRFCG